MASRGLVDDGGTSPRREVRGARLRHIPSGTRDVIDLGGIDTACGPGMHAALGAAPMDSLGGAPPRSRVV